MPPLEWSIFQSLLLDVAVPSFSVASIILLLTMAWTTNAIPRADAAKVAMICGLAAGIFRRELVPYWTLELGWYSLFSAQSL